MKELSAGKLRGRFEMNNSRVMGEEGHTATTDGSAAMDDEQVIAQFYGSIPPIASACNLGGDGAARLKIDVPESDLPEVLKFMALGREQLLRITVESAGE